MSRQEGVDVRLNIELKDSIYEALKSEADRQGRSLSDIVRVLVIEYIEERHGIRRTVGHVGVDPNAKRELLG